MIVTGIFPPDVGGPATFVSRVAQAWSEQGHGVTVVTLADAPEESVEPLPFRLVRILRRSPKLWRRLRTILAILGGARGADVLFINGLALEANIANSVLRLRQVHKVVGDKAWEMAVTTRETSDSFEDFQRAPQTASVDRLRRLRSRWTCRADAVIVPSRYLGRIVAGWGVPEERLIVVYNAVQIPDEVEVLRIPLYTSSKVISVGRLVPWKGLAGLIRAVAKLPDVGLAIVGDGLERERLERLARDQGCADRIWFAGLRDHVEALGLMAAADLFVLNSTYEGLPHAVLEAQALRTPVVASDAGGTAEAVFDGETGRLVPVNDEETLATAMMEVLRDAALRHRLAGRAREHVSRFTLERMADETLTVLRGDTQREVTK